MGDVDPFLVYDVVVGLLGAVGVVALLSTQRDIRYRRFTFFVVLGFLLFLVVGPAVKILLPVFEEFVHGFAALALLAAFVSLVREGAASGEWPRAVFADPSQIRARREWMTPLDDEILELFHDTELTLTPSIIAYNLDYHSKEVNRHLMKLSENGFLDRVERGKYQLTERGDRYLTGGLDDTF